MLANTIETHITDVIQMASSKYEFHRELLDELGAKSQSESISKILEMSFKSIVPDARTGRGDHEADVYINEIPLELKTTKKSRSWRGGEYSKRSGDFLLISWDMDANGNIMWFAIHAVLEKSDWISSGSKNYYATTISLDEVIAKGGKVLYGDVRKAKKWTHPVFTGAA